MVTQRPPFQAPKTGQELMLSPAAAQKPPATQEIVLNGLGGLAAIRQPNPFQVRSGEPTAVNRVTWLEFVITNFARIP